MKAEKIANVVGFIIGRLIGFFILAAAGLWGLSHVFPEVFTFDLGHLVPLWVVMIVFGNILCKKK